MKISVSHAKDWLKVVLNWKIDAIYKFIGILLRIGDDDDEK